MNQNFWGWKEVAKLLKQRSSDDSLSEKQLNQGQRASLHAIAERIVSNGVLVADEVGMGKTRIAVEVVHAVKKAFGRVAILAPPGLGYQWQAELRAGSIQMEKGIVRSLYGYLSAWGDEDPNKHQPWFDQPVVMISHGFANFRFGENSRSWRWSLLPEVYSHWHKSKRNGRWPRYYQNDGSLDARWAKNAALSITRTIRDTLDSNTKPWQLLNELHEIDNWMKLLNAAEYGKGGDWRCQLERVVGLGFGLFDLIVIDEAHRNRRDNSGLAHLLNNVILKADDSRCLALTATPIELDVGQWTETLRRLDLTPEQLREIQKKCEDYAEKVSTMRDNWPAVSDDDFERFKKSATRFKASLSSYLIRRDKSADPLVKRFMDHTGEHFHAYRREITAAVDPASLSDDWRIAICAAEALSFVAHQATDGDAKRLRLTLANGHGLVWLLDQQTRKDDEDGHQEKHDEDSARERGEMSGPDSNENADDDKRRARVDWWENVIKKTFEQSAGSIYDHPAILKAVEVIEGETRKEKGEKVLVFGKFTAPMRALVHLLNAREMLRRINADETWPQSKVHQDADKKGESEWPAVEAAFRQLSGCLDKLENLDDLDVELKRRYDADSRNRERFRLGLIGEIENGLEAIHPAPRVKALFKAFKNSVQLSKGEADDNGTLALVGRALWESTDDRDDAASLAAGFQRLVDAVTDRDDMDETEESDDDRAEEGWSEIVERLKEEFDTTRGGFARLMYGGTSQHSRRMIQLAFNRPNSFPKVLVAQSMVGREGLNLHEACRIVILLHPEWNPGVVEQQIGRVDRLGSHWTKQLDKAMNANMPADELPRIEVRPIIFRGTYDEHNWQVLKDRWDTLRSQLHGIVIAETMAGDNAERKKRLKEINDASPDFSPTNSCSAPTKDRLG